MILNSLSGHQFERFHCPTEIAVVQNEREQAVALASGTTSVLEIQAGSPKALGVFYRVFTYHEAMFASNSPSDRPSPFFCVT